MVEIMGLLAGKKTDAASLALMVAWAAYKFFGVSIDPQTLVDVVFPAVVALFFALRRVSSGPPTVLPMGRARVADIADRGSP